MAPSTRCIRRGASDGPAAKKPKRETDAGAAWETVVKAERPKVDASSDVKASGVIVNGSAVAALKDAGGELRVKDDDGSDEPYPSFARPTPEECWFARDALAQLHSAFYAGLQERTITGGVKEVGPGTLALPAPGGESDVGGVSTRVDATPPTAAPDATRRKSVLDSLVGTILSQHTTDVNSHRAFAGLKARFPTWESVRTAKPRAVEESIKCGGLAEIKVARIQTILNTLREERGAACMEYLRDMDDDEAKRELGRFKGVGPKTISCVMMFCLDRAEFPVDTHVWKIALALGWVPKGAGRDAAYEHLNRRVPNAAKFDLHVLLVEHGKVYKNDVKWLKKAVHQQLSGGGELEWVHAMEAPGGIKTAAEEHYALKSSAGGVCG